MVSKPIETEKGFDIEFLFHILAQKLTQCRYAIRLAVEKTEQYSLNAYKLSPCWRLNGVKTILLRFFFHYQFAESGSFSRFVIFVPCIVYSLLNLKLQKFFFVWNGTIEPNVIVVFLFIHDCFLGFIENRYCSSYNKYSFGHSGVEQKKHETNFVC